MSFFVAIFVVIFFCESVRETREHDTVAYMGRGSKKTHTFSSAAPKVRSSFALHAQAAQLDKKEKSDDSLKEEGYASTSSEFKSDKRRRGQEEHFARRDDYQRIERFYNDILSEWGVRHFDDIFGGFIMRGVFEKLSEGGHLAVQGEHIFYNIIAKIIDKDDFPPRMQKFINDERAWMESTLPPDSQVTKIRRIFGKKESMQRKYLRARWTSALTNIDTSNPPGKALFNYFQKRYRTSDPSKWIKRTSPNMQRDLLLLDGTRALGQDEELKPYGDKLYREESRLREEATVGGKAPSDTLFLLPHPGWMDPRSQFGDFSLYDHERDLTIGVHQGDIVCIFADTIRGLTSGEGIDPGEQILHVARHELIHDRQNWEPEKAWEIDLQEALTENMNILRSYPPYRKDPRYEVRKDFPLRLSRQFQITVLENLLVDRVGKEKYPQYIESLNGKTFSAMKKELQKLFPSGIEKAWNQEAYAERARYSNSSKELF